MPRRSLGEGGFEERVRVSSRTKPSFFANEVEYRRRDDCLTYKGKGEKMKRFIAFLAVVTLATFVSAKPAAAFPGERMPSRAAHFAGKVADKIDNHVIHPVTHGVARRLR